MLGGAENAKIRQHRHNVPPLPMFRTLVLLLAFAVSALAAPVLQTVVPAPGSTVSSLTQISVTFSEVVSGVDAVDLEIDGETADAVSGSGAGPYVFTFTEPSAGLVSVSFDFNAQITDLSGGLFVAGDGWEYTLEDTVAPVLVATTPASGATVTSLTQVEVIFSEPVTGVDAADLRMNGVAAQSVTGSEAGPYVFSFAQPAIGGVGFTWAAGHGITDTSPAANAFAGGGWTATRGTTIGTLVISEFLAANGTGLMDEDGSKEDWIEIQNTGTGSVSLAGWSLTESSSNLRKWTFPARTLGAGQYLVVFASGKNRRPTSGTLHTNFKLNENGSYLALVGPEYPAVAVSVFNEYPSQRYDYSYGRSGANLVYFSPPTPGLANTSTAFTGVTPPPVFSVARRVFESPFQLSLSCAAPTAAIRYTTDGSEPTASTGILYAGPVTIQKTAVIRAAAFASGLVPSVTVTQSYLSMNGVLTQNNTPSGYPSTWGNGGTVFSPARSDTKVPADYEMDPEVVNDPTLYEGKTNAQRIRESFNELPVMSIVMKIDDMFGSNGLYPKSTTRGTFEKPCSVEMILPNGETAFATVCGIRMHGNSSRIPDNNPKHGFKLKFKGDYGASKLKYRLFPDSPIEEFDDLVLRADYNSSWRHWDSYQRDRGTRLRDAWSKDTAREMGVVSGHNRFVHLFINGIYWGTYDPTEQVTDDFGKSYLGGTKADYDVYDQGDLKAGTSAAYNAMLSIQSPIDTAKYEQMKQYLDVPEFMDYMLHHFFIGHEDWGDDVNKNWYAIRNRNGGGFKYIPWDQENILFEPGTNRVNVSRPASGLHPKLTSNPQYKLDFADRVHRHMVAPGGVLRPEANIARWAARVREMDNATVAESARWGDYRRDVHRRGSAPLFTREHFVAENNRLMNTYFPARTNNVLSHLRNAGLYPNVAAPEYRKGSAAGAVLGTGHLASATQVVLTSPGGGGTIFYTTDGTDPRVYNSGATSPKAQTYSSPVSVNASITLKSRVLSGGTWSALNEAVFTVGTMASPIRITEIMYNPPGGSEYEFLELQNVTTQPVDVSGWYFGGITFVMPLGTVLPPGKRIVLASKGNPAAWAVRYPGVSVFGYFSGALDNAGERISLRNAQGRTMTSVNYSPKGLWPQEANGGGYSLELIHPLADPDSPWSWQAVTLRGTPGLANTASATPTVVISEVLAKNSGAVHNGATSPDYVELQNPGDTAVNLSGWRLITTNEMIFPEGTSIPAGGYLVIWCDSNFAAPGLHTGGGSLAREKGDVALFRAGVNTPVDAVRYGAQIVNFAIGRVAGEWKLITPSPGAANVPVALAPPTALRLNEWLANTGADADDFVELFNTHATLPVALQGVQLTAGSELHRIEVLAFVAPRGFVAFLADEKPGPNHVNFKLPAAGTTLTLLDPESTRIDTITYGPQLSMIAEGRFLDGENTISGGLTPSPGAPNALPPAPTITQQPVNRSVQQGASVTFTVAATGSNPLTYQWRREGVDLPGQTQPTLTLSGVTFEQAGSYTCRVRNTAGSVVSEPAQLVVQYSFEQWRGQHFTAAELGDPAISGMTADPDQDGLSNLEEFFHGLNPRQPDSGAAGGILPTLAIEEGTPRYVTLTFRRSGRAFLSAVTLEASPSLQPGAWNAVNPSAIIEEVTPETEGGGSLVRWKLPLNPVEARKFLRLRLLP